MGQRSGALAGVVCLDPEEDSREGCCWRQKADRSALGHPTLPSLTLMPEKEELGPTSSEGEPGCLVNNEVSVPNTRGTPLGAHSPSPPHHRENPPQPLGRGWDSEEEAAYLGYRQEANCIVGDAAGNPGVPQMGEIP